MLVIGPTTGSGEAGEGPTGPSGARGPTGPAGPTGAGVAVAAERVGQVLYSVDGATFEARTPITTRQGWLVNNQGLLLVQ
jgi:hypothetical protein